MTDIRSKLEQALTDKWVIDVAEELAYDPRTEPECLAAARAKIIEKVLAVLAEGTPTEPTT